MLLVSNLPKEQCPNDFVDIVHISNATRVVA